MKCIIKLDAAFRNLFNQRSLEIEFRLRGLKAIAEKEIALYYKNEKVGARRVHFIIENKITIEIKAILKLEDRDIAQAINYLEAFNIEIGMLLNFGSTSLEYRRLYHPEIVRAYKKNNKLKE